MTDDTASEWCPEKEGLGWAWGVSGKSNTNGRQQAAKVERGLLFLVMIHVMGTGLYSCYK